MRSDNFNEYNNSLKKEDNSLNNDIFTRKILNVPFSAELSQSFNYVAMAVSEQTIIMATKNKEIYRWLLSDSLVSGVNGTNNLLTPNPSGSSNSVGMNSGTPNPLSSSAYKMLIPINEPKASIYKIFANNKGHHNIISLEGKEGSYAYYFNIKSNKIRELFKIKDINILIDSIGWDEKCTNTSTNQILLGTDKGFIYSLQIDYDPKQDTIKEKISMLINLRTGNIFGIGFEHYNIKSAQEGLRYVVAVTDSHFYQFLGPSNFEVLFKKYKDQQKYLDNACKVFPPGDILKSQLQFLYKDDSLHSFGWMCGAGFCYGVYSKDPYDLLIKNFTIVPYAKIEKDGNIGLNEVPISIAHSEYHIYLLFGECITIISKITNNIVKTENVGKGIISMQFDKNTNSLFLFSTKILYQITIEGEDRDVWKAHLEKGEFIAALEHCEAKNLPEVKKVSKLYANHLFDSGEYVQSAIHYGKSDEKFEEVALKFLLTQSYDALKLYLQIIDSKFNNFDHTQKSLIATWLVEIYLNELSNANDSSSYKMLKEGLRDLLKEKLECLDKNTIYQLLQQYGRVQEFLDFAEAKKDYEAVILHYINEKDIKGSIRKLYEFTNQYVPPPNPSTNPNDKKNPNDLYNIFAKYSHIFMKNEPEETIELLLKNFKSNIDPNKIISAIMNTEIEKREKVADYLDDLIKNLKLRDKNIHNLFIFFLSQINTEASINKLLGYLQEKYLSKDYKRSESNVLFDMDYAIKIFSQFKIYSAQAFVLAIMGKLEDAIKVALDNGKVQVAKLIAANIDDTKIKKKSWLEIFVSEVKKKSDNINIAVEIMTESKVLKIEDVLPNLMDNIKIDIFKKEITSCIDKYENNISHLKTELHKYTLTAEQIQTDINQVNKKYLEVKYKMYTCEVCNMSIKDDAVYLFPCGHIFDQKCIIKILEDYKGLLPQVNVKLEKIYQLQNEVSKLEKRKNSSRLSAELEKRNVNFENKDLWNSITGLFTGKQKGKDSLMISYDEVTKLSSLKIDLNDLLCEECVLCGDIIVESISFAFDSGKPNDWQILN